MKKSLKAHTFNFLTAFWAGGAALWHSSNVVRGLAQTGVEFCKNCGKPIDRPNDVSSIRRGDICLGCHLEEKFGPLEE